MDAIVILGIALLLLYILYAPIIEPIIRWYQKERLKDSDFHEKHYDEELKDWGDGI